MTLAPTKVLVVDDDPVDREIYRRLLSQDPYRSYSVIEAGTAEEALGLHESERPDCILLDYRLPDSDGVEFLRMIAPEGDEAGLPVVMLTGQGNEKVAVEAMKAGAQDYAIKGELTSHSLAHVIESAIEKVALRRELQRKRSELDESR